MDGFSNQRYSHEQRFSYQQWAPEQCYQQQYVPRPQYQQQDNQFSWAYQSSGENQNQNYGYSSHEPQHYEGDSNPSAYQDYSAYDAILEHMSVLNETVIERMNQDLALKRLEVQMRQILKMMGVVTGVEIDDGSLHSPLSTLEKTTNAYVHSAQPLQFHPAPQESSTYLFVERIYTMLQDLGRKLQEYRESINATISRLEVQIRQCNEMMRLKHEREACAIEASRNDEVISEEVHVGSIIEDSVCYDDVTELELDEQLGSPISPPLLIIDYDDVLMKNVVKLDEIDKPSMVELPGELGIISVSVPDYYSLPLCVDEYYEIDFEYSPVDGAHGISKRGQLPWNGNFKKTRMRNFDKRGFTSWEEIASRAERGKFRINSVFIVLAVSNLLRLLVFLSLDFG